MRLTKTIYLIEDETPVIDYDPLGNPIYGDSIVTYLPVDCEIEPYSSELARTRLGLHAEVTHRAFTRPDDRLELNVPVRYDDEDNYTITELLKYDKHYEVLINRG